MMVDPRQQHGIAGKIRLFLVRQLVGDEKKLFFYTYVSVYRAVFKVFQ